MSAPVVFDSRLATPGCLFVAIPGARDDGARFAADAVRRGAATIVAATGADLGDLPPTVNVLRVENPRAELSRLAAVQYGDPSRRMAVYAVTGTNGKTTVAGLVRDILRASGRECGLLSTVEYSWPGHCETASHTTPNPVALQRMLAEMADAGCAAASMEASSHALDQDRAAAVTFAAAGFTNLTQDHFDYHHGFEDYFRCKRKLFKRLGEASPGAPAAINADDPYGRRLLADCPALGVRPTAFSLDADAAADVFAEDIRATATGTSFTLRAFGERAAVTTPLIGEYNISNILCAAAMTIATGVPLAAVAETVAAARPRWGRLEPFDTPSGARVFVDFAHTPDALSRALAALRPLTKGRLIAVFGCGGDRDRAKRPLMAAAAAKAADLVVITSDNPRSEDPESIIDEAVRGLAGSTSPWRRCADRRAAIAGAIAEAGNGDVILVAGKGHENYQEINGVKHHFDDREVVRTICGV